MPVEVRVNANPASGTTSRALNKALRNLAEKVRAMVRPMDFDGTIDLDYFEEEAGAFAPLIVDIFPRAYYGENHPKLLFGQVYPVDTDRRGRVSTDEAYLAIESLEENEEEILRRIKEAILRIDSPGTSVYQE